MPKFPVPPSWVALQNHLVRWFHRPDFQALQVTLSAVAAHPIIQGDPIWLFVQGPSGSGKGEIVVNAVRDLNGASVLGAVNRHSFISFAQGEVGGILPNLPRTGRGDEKTGILIFKDFTTMLSLRDEERTEVISQLREIYDGSWSRATGSGRHDWVGKVTCIAACTPALESAWALKRDLGERFLTVRWPRIGSTALAKAAGRQRGYETMIRSTTTQLGTQLIKSANMTSLPDIPEPIFDKIGALSEFVAILRAAVPRSPSGKREINSEPVPEEPGRIHKSLSALVSAHAGLWHDGKVAEESYQIAMRVGLDSIPLNRLNIFLHMPLTGDLITSSQLAKAVHVPLSTVTWGADEMTALGVLEKNEEGDINEYRVSDKFRGLVQEAHIQANRSLQPLVHSPVQTVKPEPTPPRTDPLWLADSPL